MALDEAVLECYRGGDAPVFRLYQWRPAALSLGRFQALSDLAALPAEIPRVRRITGGGALHHREDEVTYALVAPYALFSGGRRASPRVAYLAVHAAIARGLEGLGLAALSQEVEASCATAETGCPPLCYDRATDFDLRAGRGKLVGSAQRRRGNAFLQHGAIPVSADPFATGAAALSTLLGRTPALEEIKAAVVRGVEGAFEVLLVAAAPTPLELERARALEGERYAGEQWTRDRP
jgi:lipoate-protein ligase A